jgi:hypothetical protein
MILQRGGSSLANAVASALSIAIVVARRVTVKNGWLKRYNNI